jgi:choline dehydrogenase-like flavoprotein
MHVSELPRAVRAGALVRERVVVREVIVENGRAVGIRAEAGERAVPYEARARAVLLAGGALGTPELLLRQGLANSSGKVGRHLRIHPVCWVGGLFDEAVDGWNGVMQSWYVDEWHNRGITLEATFTPLPYAAHWLRGAGEEFKSKVEDFGRLGMVGVQYEDTSEGRVTLRGKRGIRIGYRVSRADGENIRFGIARAAQVMFAAGATEAYPQVGRVGPITPGQEVTLVEQARVAPAALRLEAFHPMGTTRMGADPRTSVVGPDGQTHDVPGLYVADSGLFPTATRVNPMVTIMAFARRIAAGIAEGLA